MKLRTMTCCDAKWMICSSDMSVLPSTCPCCHRHVRAAIDTNYLHREMEKALARERMTIVGHNSLADAARASREQREVLRRGLLACHNPLSTGISEEELEQDDYLEMYADDITLQLALPRLMDELNTPLKDVPRANPQVAEQCP